MEAIYAVDIKNGISKDGILPWKCKKDMLFFMNKTKNNIVIMGRNTYFSLPKRPLKDRLNIVFTREPNKYSQGTNVLFTDDINIFNYVLENRESYLELYKFLNTDFKIYIIGGKEIYEKLIPFCKKIWVTKLKQEFNCDLFLNYDYSIQYEKEILDDDDELTISVYSKLE